MYILIIYTLSNVRYDDIRQLYFIFNIFNTCKYYFMYYIQYSILNEEKYYNQSRNS